MYDKELVHEFALKGLVAFLNVSMWMMEARKKNCLTHISYFTTPQSTSFLSV